MIRNGLKEVTESCPKPSVNSSPPLHADALKEDAGITVRLNSTRWEHSQAPQNNGATLSHQSQVPLASHTTSEPSNRTCASKLQMTMLSPDKDFSPPMNFAIVERGLYRSSFPTKKNFSYLKKLGLKAILTLVVEEYPAKNRKFMRESGIDLIQIGLRSNKEPFVKVKQEKIEEAILKILDTRNHPMLIHCNKGKHRTGTLVGCVRKIQKWCLAAIFAEYIRYSSPKHRVMDQQFIELFDPRAVLENVDRKHTPKWPGLSV